MRGKLDLSPPRLHPVFLTGLPFAYELHKEKLEDCTPNEVWLYDLFSLEHFNCPASIEFKEKADIWALL